MRNSPSRQEIQDMTPAQRSAWLNGQDFRDSGAEKPAAGKVFTPALSASVQVALTISDLRERAEEAELRAKRWLQKLTLVEDAIVHLHRPRRSVDGIDRCNECLTAAPCRTIVAFEEARS